MPRRPVCLACVSVEVEGVVDGERADVELFACFDCWDVFYFMADTRPCVRRLGLFEVYGEPAPAEGEVPALSIK